MNYYRRLAGVVALLLILPHVLSATSGSFRGTLVRGPKHEAGWIYLLGRNGLLRRVGISRARVVYSGSIPRRDRADKAHESLQEGVDVRVTAEQHADGEWHATDIEILSLKAAAPARPGSSDEDEVNEDELVEDEAPPRRT